jgi:hypothetical protein
MLVLKLFSLIWFGMVLGAFCLLLGMEQKRGKTWDFYEYKGE